MAAARRYVYRFGEGRADGDASLRDLLGGKGANLAEMARLGLPVPPGFTITTEVCGVVLATGGLWPDGLGEELEEAMAALEAATGRRLGDPEHPLLVSVRSGAPVSMPGMMDTILNLGLTPTTAEGLARATGNPRFAWDSYRRFLYMYGEVVLRIHATSFTRALRERFGERDPGELDAEGLRALCDLWRGVIVEAGEGEGLDDPRVQLVRAIDAVFASFHTHRARYYRKVHGIPDDIGTAVNVQAMVFGNLGEDSGTGVAFTRHPATGAPGLFGEWLPNAQGEDVVAGTHTPRPLDRRADPEAAGTLEEVLPEAYRRLVEVRGLLERHYRDMQDIEFTIERGRLYLLQTRTGKRTPAAGVRIAVDLAEEGIITRDEAILRVPAESLESVLRPVLDPSAPRRVIATGLPASPGAATGRVVFHSEEAQELADRGEPAILVRMETSPEDIQGMTVAEGILTSRGGQTSHAAVVARGMGKPCIVGATDILVDTSRALFYAGETVVRKGDWITIDGASGQVLLGRVPTIAPPGEAGAMGRLLSWADERARLEVRANADNAADAARARELGARGIGLCRTEHMFFQPQALRAMRQLILAADERTRSRALSEVLPLQRAAFVEIFRAMDGLPVTIRLLDPPLHEFLPRADEDIATVAADLGVQPDALRERLAQLAELNPMMGHRGVRLGITTPGIYETQIRAILEAALDAKAEGLTVHPEIMVPLVAMPEELAEVREHVEAVADDVFEERGEMVDYLVGTMIELPRAAILAERIAHHADFFSFGTNDLTQMTWGFSRDDMGRFFPRYQMCGLLKDSPLAVFDADGVGELVRMGTERGRRGRRRLKVGVCGEHGGDPAGVRFFHRAGLDYVSCSPYRVPVARLAAAQAALEA